MRWKATLREDPRPLASLVLVAACNLGYCCAMRAIGHRYTWKEYLALNETSNVKLEYFDGEIFAMAGGTPEHSALAMAIAIELGKQLERRPCRVYNSDLRIRVHATGLGTYPDVTIVRGDPKYDPEDKNTIINPTVLVEVLSDSTEAYDRADKFSHYWQIESLQEYVLVSHREQLIEVYQRAEAKTWTRTEARTQGKAQIQSMNCLLPVDRIYAGIELHRTG